MQSPAGARGRRGFGRYERGVPRPSADAVQRLADTLGVSADYLMEGSTEAAARAFLTKKQIQRLAG